MEPITVGIICFIAGALAAGAGTYSVQEKDKERLRTKNLELQNRVSEFSKMAIEGKKAIDRLTLRNIQLALKNISQKIELMQQSENVSLQQYVMLHGMQQEVAAILTAVQNGEKPTNEQKRAIETLNNSETDSPSPEEMNWLIEYIVANHAANVNELLRQLFVGRMETAIDKRQRLIDSKYDLEVEIEEFKSKLEVEGFNEPAQKALLSKQRELRQIPEESSQLEQRINYLRQTVVILTRLKLKTRNLSGEDNIVIQIMEKTVRGEDISDEQLAFLLAYSKKYYPEVRAEIEKDTGKSMRVY